MAATDFGTKSETQRAWAKQLIRESEPQSFFKNLMSTNGGVIVRAESLKKTDGATEAMHKMLPGMQGSGVTGKNRMRGNEETLTAQYLKVKIGRIRNAVISDGKLSDQGSVINFREEVMKSLAEWRAEQYDRLLMKTLAGINFNLALNGGAEVVLAGQQSATTLAFAGDVSAPTANRHFNAAGSSGIALGSTSAITAGSTISYDGILELVGEARTQRLRGVKAEGMDNLTLVLHPKQWVQLKKDAKFNSALINGGIRGDSNPIFTGAHGITVDGLVIRVTDLVYNTSKATSGNKWGSGGLVNGARALLLGQQAAFMTDLVEDTDWKEEGDDYDEFQGIQVGMLMGMRKAVFTTTYNGTAEDLGVIAFDTAL